MADEIIKPTIYVIRTKVFITSKSENGERAVGERGILVAGTVSYHTLERRGGYVTLPPGEFEIEMEYSPTKKVNGKPRRQFRVLNHGVFNSQEKLAAILMHQGNYPHHVTGCIAPGKTQSQKGIGQSSKALEEIFTFCGGFGVGKRALLVIDGD
jgi:hypothetical protein